MYAQFVVLGWYSCYLLVQSKVRSILLTILLFLMPVIVLVYELRTVQKIVSVAALIYVTLAGLTALLLTLRQVKETAAQLLPTVRLLLISLTIILAGWQVVLMHFSSSAVIENVPFTYMLAMVSLVLALTSFLTPIRTEPTVQRPVY